MLSNPQAERLRAAYGIDTVATRTAASVEEAAAAEAIGDPLALTGPPERRTTPLYCLPANTVTQAPRAANAATTAPPSAR